MDINNINLNNGYKLIEASAGTGKTFTLAHLFLRSYFEKKHKIEKLPITKGNKFLWIIFKFYRS